MRTGKVDRLKVESTEYLDLINCNSVLDGIGRVVTILLSRWEMTRGEKVPKNRPSEDQLTGDTRNRRRLRR